MKTVCLMFTGQLRTFKLCYPNIVYNLIKPNITDFKFYIYIYADYDNRDLQSIKECIEINEYIGFVQLVFIDNCSNIIYPELLKHANGACICLYKNKLLFEKISEKDKYDIFIRLRPDIKLTNTIILDNINLHRNIHIISSNSIRDDNPNNLGSAHIHNKDWNYMIITDKEGMMLWCDFYNFLEPDPSRDNNFLEEVRFNNNGYWVKDITNSNNRYVIPIQAFFKNIKNNNFNVIFDSCNCFAYIYRI